MAKTPLRTVLRTTSLTLGPCRPTDREDFIALERDPDVMRYLDGGNAIGPDRSMEDAPFLMPRGTEDYVWTARLTNGEDFVGWFCLWPMGGTTAELGYRLDRASWGRGLATEGASALVGWAFAAGGYDKVMANVMAENRASRRVLEKIGFRHARTVGPGCLGLIPGSETGDVEYEIERSGWAGR